MSLEPSPFRSPAAQPLPRSWTAPPVERPTSLNVPRVLRNRVLGGIPPCPSQYPRSASAYELTAKRSSQPSSSASTQQTPPPIIAVTSIVAAERNPSCWKTSPAAAATFSSLAPPTPDETSCAEVVGETASGVPPRDPTMM